MAETLSRVPGDAANDRALVWDLGLARYSEHRAFQEQLAETTRAPHELLFVMAMYYLNRLDIWNQEHASGIYALGEVVRFTGQLANAYRPDAADVDDQKEEADSKGKAN